MSRLDQILTWIENTIAALALGSATLLTILGVILRYLFGYSIFWGEEAVIYLLILSTFIGAVIALRHNEHVGVDALSFLFRARGRWILAILSTLIGVIYCVAFGTQAWLMISEPALQNTVTPALGIPLWIVELSVPIGLTLMLVRALEILYRTARNQQAFPEAEENGYEESGI